MKDTTANFIFSGKRTVNYSSLSKWKNWKKPYDNPNIDSIVTGLQGKFAYSPKFRKPIAETSIVLTGYRRKDYCEAEQVTNEIHQPKKTVWHHVWEEKNGKYTIQLVDYTLHQTTCPHVGACKMWSMRTGKRYNYSYIKKHISLLINKNIINNPIIKDYLRLKTITKPRIAKNADSFSSNGYVDLVLDDVFTKQEAEQQYSIRVKIKHRQIIIHPFGIDPYGNLFYIDKKMNLFFMDLEDFILFPVHPKQEVLYFN